MIWGKILKLWYRGKYQQHFPKEWSDHWYYWKDFYSSLLFQLFFCQVLSFFLSLSLLFLATGSLHHIFFSWFKNSHHHQINFHFLTPQDFLILPDWVTLEGFRATTNFLSFFLSFHFRLKVMNMKCQVWRNEGRMRDRKQKEEKVTWIFDMKVQIERERDLIFIQV